MVPALFLVHLFGVDQAAPWVGWALDIAVCALGAFRAIFPGNFGHHVSRGAAKRHREHSARHLARLLLAVSESHVRVEHASRTTRNDALGAMGSLCDRSGGSHRHAQLEILRALQGRSTRPARGCNVSATKKASNEARDGWVPVPGQCRGD